MWMAEEDATLTHNGISFTAGGVGKTDEDVWTISEVCVLSAVRNCSVYVDPQSCTLYIWRLRPLLNGLIQCPNLFLSFEQSSFRQAPAFESEVQKTSN